MLTYTPTTKYKPGDLANIIRRSYAKLIEENPEHWREEEKKWDNFDKQAFAVPAIGKCLFVTCLDRQPVGLASWDSRPWPEYGEIGQNCVLPEFRGKGIGAKQIQKVLMIFRGNGVKKAKVTTSEHPFFEPARKMYQSLGFREVKRTIGGPDPRYKLIEFEMEL